MVEQQIADLEEKRGKLMEEITVKSDKIAKTMSDFERAMDKVMFELQTERTRVHTFLGKGGG